MNKELILKAEDKIIYLEEIMFSYELFKDKIKNINSFYYVSEIDSSLLSLKNTIFFSLDQLKGIGCFENQIIARNEIMNLLMFFKTIIGEVFSIYPIDGMIESEEEKYAIYFTNNYDCLEKIFEVTLEEKDKMFSIKFGFIDLKNTIYHIINSEVNRLSFSSSKIQVGVLPIQKEKEGVMSCVKVLKKELEKFYRVKIFSSTNSYLDDEKRVLNLGIPLIVEVGPSNIKKEQVTICSTYGKIQVSISNLITEIKEKGKAYDRELKSQSIDRVINKQKKVLNFKEIKEGNKFVCCKNIECIDRIKKEKELSELVMPFSQVIDSNECICCGKKGQTLFFGKK